MLLQRSPRTEEAPAPHDLVWFSMSSVEFLRKPRLRLLCLASSQLRSLVEDRASTMSVNISVPDDERSLVEDRASTMSVNISVPDDERSLVEERASIMSVNISVLMMSM
ncbi:hypothetical protein DNTS_003135 [Danionella cerebrum]|uniref:Uncharacterized protein n=1 Tax=Danionella cerebrum TaxID=2873325 RepID=A0A553NGP3_9TELE|nr:hypothetical protein DNTS_003135 [Danionella translucida]